MSRRTLLVLLALLTPVALLSQMASKDLAVGTWKLNVAKSKFDPGPAPVRSTVIIGEDGKISYSDESADGKSSSWSVTPSPDGTPATLIGVEGSTLVAKKIDDRHVEHTWKFGDATETGKSAISKNGKVMTYMLTGTNPDGKQIHTTEIFEKQ